MNADSRGKVGSCRTGLKAGLHFGLETTHQLRAGTGEGTELRREQAQTTSAPPPHPHPRHPHWCILQPVEPVRCICFLLSHWLLLLHQLSLPLSLPLSTCCCAVHWQSNVELFFQTFLLPSSHQQGNTCSHFSLHFAPKEGSFGHSGAKCMSLRQITVKMRLSSTKASTSLHNSPSLIFLSLIGAHRCTRYSISRCIHSFLIT